MKAELEEEEWILVMGKREGEEAEGADGWPAWGGHSFQVEEHCVVRAVLGTCQWRVGNLPVAANRSRRSAGTQVVDSERLRKLQFQCDSRKYKVQSLLSARGHVAFSAVTSQPARSRHKRCCGLQETEDLSP